MRKVLVSVSSANLVPYWMNRFKLPKTTVRLGLKMVFGFALLYYLSRKGEPADR